MSYDGDFSNSVLPNVSGGGNPKRYDLTHIVRPVECYPLLFAQLAAALRVHRQIKEIAHTGGYQKLDDQMDDGYAQRILVRDEQIAIVECQRDGEEVVDKDGRS